MLNSLENTVRVRMMERMENAVAMMTHMLKPKSRALMSFAFRHSSFVRALSLDVILPTVPENCVNPGPCDRRSKSSGSMSNKRGCNGDLGDSGDMVPSSNSGISDLCRCGVRLPDRAGDTSVDIASDQAP